ncbi:DUF1566 domain-containing protein [Hydrogenophaga sp. RWCD_12]|uniref:DUF1566 domain-containing protein n=1 Tax=Hydrogenophaga sp. RWCD_12 TaxID=3391190 RepID=UPI003984F397
MFSTTSLWSRLPRARWLLAFALIAGLVACGGSGSSSGVDNSGPTTGREAALAAGPVLNAAELAAAEKSARLADAAGDALPLEKLPPGQIAAKTAYLSGSVARKAAAVRIPVYRFYNSATGAHFFTTSTAERDNVINTLSPPFSHEGEAFSVASDFSPGLSPVHRFYNTQSGVHFYTISETERANVVANLPQFQYEGVAYHASQVSGQGLLPFYRFYVPSRGFHFYTASEEEKNSIIANLAAVYSFEGVGYYVLDTNWTSEKLPHTGLTDQQCYQSGSNTLVACSGSGALALYPQQDGHRTAVNPMSYSALRASLVLNHPLTSCVRDNVTGLVWEGKTDDGGLRDKDNAFTNLGNGLSDDTSGYVVLVNDMNLCGYSDWRLPTRQELLGIADHGVVTPSIESAWFPNTFAGRFWSANVDGADSLQAWFVDFNDGSSSYTYRSLGYGVRLVHGSTSSSPRFSFGSVPYGSDAANNLVNDAWTGLQWRRCEEGRTWNGSTCTGTVSTYTHEQALTHAKGQTGWRLPNVKELSSLVDTGRSSGARIDPASFPGASGTWVWSSSPFVGNTTAAWDVVFGNGNVEFDVRTRLDAVRLVRVPQ